MQLTAQQLGHNATASEVYRLTGNLPAEMIEDLLEGADWHETANTEADGLRDALSPISEDFMQEEIDDLRGIIEGMRKSETKLRLQTLLENMENTQSKAARAVEYSDDIIGKAIDVLEG